MSVLSLFFGWPAGAVWGNLLASAICSGGVWWRLHKQSARQHVEHLAVMARNHFDLMAQAQAAHEAQMKQMKQHHAEQLARADAYAAAAGLPAAAAAGEGA